MTLTSRADRANPGARVSGELEVDRPPREDHHHHRLALRRGRDRRHLAMGGGVIQTPLSVFFMGNH